MVRKSKQIRNNRTVIFIIAFFILGLAVSFIFQKLIKSKSDQDNIPKNAKLSLQSDKEKISAGEELTVTMTLDSNNSEVAAADFVVRFNPQYLKVVSVITGNFFNNYPINTTGSDHVRLSGVATFDGNTLILPKGSAPVGYIKFQALSNKGQAVISIDESKTIVATSGQDILDKKNINKLNISVI